MRHSVSSKGHRKVPSRWAWPLAGPHGLPHRWPAPSRPRPTDQLAWRPPCPLPTSTACTNIVSQLSLKIVPSPTGPVNYYMRIINYVFGPGRAKQLRFSVGAAGLKLCPHTFTGFLGPTRCVYHHGWPSMLPQHTRHLSHLLAAIMGKLTTCLMYHNTMVVGCLIRQLVGGV